jgi:hypothetical protein
MSAIRRNLWIAALLFVLLVAGTMVLTETLWVAALAVLLGLAGVVTLTGNRWRSGALLISAMALSVGLLDAIAGWMAPAPIGAGLVRTTVPAQWTVSDSDLGYRPAPDTNIRADASFGDQKVFSVTYTINPDGTRATPAAPEGANTYLFLGDSFVFGQGLADDQSLAAQFARVNNFKVRTITFAAPGYSANHLVRAFEAGRFDNLRGQPVKAVVTWIIPAHLARVTGDGPWLGSSPRYVLEDGKPHYTGSFGEHRLLNPLAGLGHAANERFAFVRAIGTRQRQERQAELFTALMVRLQQLARERLQAPLMVIYSWPDETSGPNHDDSEVAQPMLVSILAGLRQHGIPLLSVDDLTAHMEISRLLIPHDGHPTAFTNELIAGELKRRLAP